MLPAAMTLSTQAKSGNVPISNPLHNHLTGRAGKIDLPQAVLHGKTTFIKL
jgi:hypothetical protein